MMRVSSHLSSVKHSCFNINVCTAFCIGMRSQHFSPSSPCSFFIFYFWGILPNNLWLWIVSFLTFPRAWIKNMSLLAAVLLGRLACTSFYPGIFGSQELSEGSFLSPNSSVSDWAQSKQLFPSTLPSLWFDWHWQTVQTQANASTNSKTEGTEAATHILYRQTNIHAHTDVYTGTSTKTYWQPHFVSRYSPLACHCSEDHHPVMSP